jgi:cysteine synthase A/cysteine synthase B
MNTPNNRKIVEKSRTKALNDIENFNVPDGQSIERKKHNFNHQLRVYEDVVDLIASPKNPTPLIKLNERINPYKEFPIYLKLERYNPFGSIKDRIAISMLEELKIQRDQTVIEPSSGNTGIALASIAKSWNFPIEIAVPQGIPEEKKILLKLLGVNVLWEAEDDLCPTFPNEGARGLVRGLINSSGSETLVNPNQYENFSNVRAHYTTTGPEIWNQTKGEIKYFFAGLGTCGTITGVGKYLKEKNPSIEVLGIEPSKENHNLPGMKRITGLDEKYIPKILDKSILDDIIEIDDDTAYKTGIKLARSTGILVGPTTGAILAAALQHAKRKEGLAVVISPDDASKYVSSYAPYIKDDGKPQL